jgi:hypothetical protein
MVPKSRVAWLTPPPLLVRCQVHDKLPRGTHSRLAEGRLSLHDFRHPESAGLRGDGVKAEKVRFASSRGLLVGRITLIASFSDFPASGSEIYRLINQGSLTIWSTTMRIITLILMS